MSALSEMDRDPAEQLRFFRGRFRLLTAAGPSFPVGLQGEQRCPDGSLQFGNTLYRIETELFSRRQSISQHNLLSGLCHPENGNWGQVYTSTLPLNTWTPVMHFPPWPKGKEGLVLLFYPTDRFPLADPSLVPPIPAFQYVEGGDGGHRWEQQGRR